MKRSRATLSCDGTAEILTFFQSKRSRHTEGALPGRDHFITPIRGEEPVAFWLGFHRHSGNFEPSDETVAPASEGRPL
jgi:hypothetical protein